jgi:hypothetical protein
MYYNTKTSLRVTPQLEIIYGSWDPRFPDVLHSFSSICQYFDIIKLTQLAPRLDSRYR